MSINSFVYGFRKYGKFSSKELKNFLITIIILGFIIGFNDKRTTSSVDLYYVLFMLFSMIAVAFALFLKLLIQRIWFYKYGQNPEYKFSINTLLIGIVLVFASEGHLWLLAPGYTITTLLQGERLGKWRYGLKYFEHGLALAFGVWGLLLIAVILSVFQTASTVLINHVVNIFLALAIYSVLPLPENDGLYIMYARRWVYILTVSLVFFITVFLKLFGNPWMTLFGALLLSASLVILYNIKVEK